LFEVQLVLYSNNTDNLRIPTSIDISRTDNMAAANGYSASEYAGEIDFSDIEYK
jgi:hypothetical protein